MLRVQKIKGLNVTHAVSPMKVPFDQNELAAASIPGWRMLLSPGKNYYNEDNGDLLNRISPLVPVSPRGEKMYQAVPSEFVNGKECLAFPDSGYTSIYDTGVEVNKTAWTVFAVVNLTPDTPHEIFTPHGEDIVDDTSYGLRVGFNNTGIFRIWRGDTSIRLAHGDGALYMDQLVYVMATYSTNDGLRMYRNGVEVATSPDDKAPLTVSRFTLFGTALGTISTSGMNGQFGEMGVMDISLGEPENDSYRRAVDEWLMNKYSIGR
ncbi:hypothetical protein RQV66_001247 [Vibrio alginolyticus]|uniref:LamG-like jellyroll fold domain-containing protein n=1 Tax=Vibrio alginolyticus TaxID=663 RepID=UPI002893BC3A|nr:hypothetical protein [Vibrio alginolyticus]ELI1833443.1 hypothetical protein [Vibrio alginolyticus]HCM0677263.1 hypothetical protein [Vibrio parahaemolyticus]